MFYRENWSSRKKLVGENSKSFTTFPYPGPLVLQNKQPRDTIVPRTRRKSSGSDLWDSASIPFALDTRARRTPGYLHPGKLATRVAQHNVCVFFAQLSSITPSTVCLRPFLSYSCSAFSAPVSVNASDIAQVPGFPPTRWVPRYSTRQMVIPGASSSTGLTFTGHPFGQAPGGFNLYSRHVRQKRDLRRAELASLCGFRYTVFVQRLPITSTITRTCCTKKTRIVRNQDALQREFSHEQENDSKETKPWVS